MTPPQPPGPQAPFNRHCERRRRAVPRHVAIIMDGNGRWAKKRFLPRFVGHKQGVDALRAHACRPAPSAASST